jgi:H2-forming N5,N10-methylenetetrahydromethanopterin dehydrogenase-like enzyme
MIKFYKVKDTEIRKAAKVDEDGKVVAVVAIIGRIGELVEREIISDVENFNRVRDRWLVMPKEAIDTERCDVTYETLAEAKASIAE